MLYLIGLGIHDEKDISLKGLELAKNSDKVFAEFYTNQTKVNMKKLEKLVGKKIQVLKREEVEESDILIKTAKKNKVTFLVPGDPLAATTHADLVLRLRKSKIGVEIIHASSIFSAIGETGLHLYKFGRTVSLPKPQENYTPESPYDNIFQNLLANNHTLILLDIGMTANEGMKLLLELENKKKKQMLSEDTKIIVVAHLGEKPMIKYGKINDLVGKNFGDLPHSLILPAKLHFQEEEFLKILS